MMAEAETDRARRGRRTILFVDEIHRFNKAQQDAFLPHVEKGDIVLVGATTENPSFEVNAALLSRCRVYVLQPLAEDDLVGILERALGDRERGLGRLGRDGGAGCAPAPHRAWRTATRGARSISSSWRSSSRRRARAPSAVSPRAPSARRRRRRRSSTTRPARSTTTSSRPCTSRCATRIRTGRSTGSGACSTRARIRSTSRAASSASPPRTWATPTPTRCALTLDAKEAYHFLGTPEGELALAQAACYLALAPKSNAVYAAWNAVRDDIREQPAEPVPLHLRNAPTGLMADLGYGKGYQYAHDAPDAQVDQEHLPDALRGRDLLPPHRSRAREGSRRPPSAMARAAADAAGAKPTG